MSIHFLLSGVSGSQRKGEGCIEHTSRCSRWQGSGLKNGVRESRNSKACSNGTNTAWVSNAPKIQIQYEYWSNGRDAARVSRAGSATLWQLWGRIASPTMGSANPASVLPTPPTICNCLSMCLYIYDRRTTVKTTLSYTVDRPRCKFWLCVLFNDEKSIG